MQKSTLLQSEIDNVIDDQTDKAFPNVLFFADSSSLFWVTNEGEYVWMQDHSGIEDFLDLDHIERERRYTDKSTEGVGNTGTYWMNDDFNSPFHYLDFRERIEQINVSV